MNPTTLEILTPFLSGKYEFDKNTKMAIYRQIQTTFWSDAWVIDLTPEKKYFYLYLLTNDKVKQCGIYEIPLKKIEIETGYSKETILLLLDELKQANKINYNLETNEICIINFSKYNYTKSPKVKACITKELNQVKDKKLIQYLYGIDTVYIDYVKTMETLSQEKEKEKDHNKNKNKKKELLRLDGEKINNILSFFNFKGDLSKEELLLDALLLIREKMGSLAPFYTQTEAYIAYKEVTEERRHSFINFLGINAPGGPEYGGWNSENWAVKLKKLKESGNSKALTPVKTYENDKL